MRHFFISFVGTSPKGTHQGQIVIASEDFFNNEETHKDIENEFKFTNVVITFFKELSEQDYTDYVEEIKIQN